MFLFKKKTKNRSFTQELTLILGDVGFAYKNFLHWSVSRVIIGVWSILLGLILALPIFILSLIVGLIDPIDWTVIINYIITGSDPTHDLLISGVAEHMYALAFMAIIVFFMVVVFLFGSSYNLLLTANVSHEYIKRKKLDYKKNLYFSREHIVAMLGLLTWNSLYLLAPIFLYGVVIFVGLKLTYAGVLDFNVFSYTALGISLIMVFVMSFVVYKILFGYVILSREKAGKIKGPKSYLLKSIKETSYINYFKFLGILMMLFVIMTPFRTYEDHLERTSQEYRDALAYKAGLLENINPNERAYWEYITKEYSEVSNKEIVDTISMIMYKKIIFFFIDFFLFGGLFILVATSFHRRVIQQK